MMNLDAIHTSSTIPEIIQLSYGMECANTYFLISDNHAVIIDVCSVEVVEELNHRGLTPDYVLLTHEHVDHLWGLNALRERFPNVNVIAQKRCSEGISNPKINKAAIYRIYAILRFGENYLNAEVENREYCCNPADIEFQKSYELYWKGTLFRLIHTPGHSQGSCMIFVEEKMIFSGDTMLNGKTFLGFDDSDKEQFSSFTLPVIDNIGAEMLILPGHGKWFLKKEWKR